MIDSSYNKEIRNIYIGIDPGVRGGIAVHIPPRKGLEREERTILFSVSMPDSSKKVALFFREDLSKVAERLKGPYSYLACIEKQSPRPTQWIDKEQERRRNAIPYHRIKGNRDNPKLQGEIEDLTAPLMVQSSVLRSTCILFGNYMLLVGILESLDITYLNPIPQVWQKLLGIKKMKNEKDTDWKGRLKDLALSIFPNQKVTKATADAYLLAEYARMASSALISRS